MRCKLRLIVTLLCFASSCSAQDIEVKKFKLLENDRTALMHPRKDINGELCGLVKIVQKERGLVFQGNIIGDVSDMGNEYHVYLTKGCKRINVKHRNFLPKTIVFSDYGVSKIESGKSYLLELKTDDYKSETLSSKKGTVVFSLNPTNADLYIDNRLVDREETGIYSLTLPQGYHYYSVRNEKLSVDNRQVKVGKNISKIDVNLTNYYATIAITCSVNDADILVNGKMVGSEKWKGVVPPGSLLVEVKKPGYQTLSKTFTLNENDSVSINFPDMKMLSGNLTVESFPDSSLVSVDGKNVGFTPLTIHQLSVGAHEISIEKPYYKKYVEQITIADGQNLTIRGTLLFLNKFSEVWVKANEGDCKSQYLLAQSFHLMPYPSDYWGEKVSPAPHKAVYWYKKSAEGGYAEAQSYLAYLYLSGELGVEQNNDLFYKWARKAAEQNDKWGCYYVGYAYLMGRGVNEKNTKEAVFWLRKAAIIGNLIYADELLRKIGYE